MKFYVAIPYTDAKGEHKVGQQVEFPRETDQDKASVDTLLRYGVISRDKARAERIAEGTSEPEPGVS